MPNLITHALFVEDVLQNLDNPMLNAHRKLVITGGQGPDFLFFHHSQPWKLVLGSPLRKYGNKLHHEKVNDFYATAFFSICYTQNQALKEDMISYVCGHLCHWALDSEMHQLIFSRTGNCKNRSGWAHHRFESLLDAILLKVKKNQTIETYDYPEECLSDDARTAKIISRIYIPALKALYGEEIRPSWIAEDLHDWKQIEKMMRDPHNHKKAWVQPLEKAFNLDNAISGFSVPNVVEDNVDLCNLLHEGWRHPVTGEVRTDSAFDLYEAALTKAETAIYLFLKAIEEPEDRSRLESFLDFLGDRNYDTNMAGTPEPVFCDPIDLDF